jgi:hypothetical protein
MSWKPRTFLALLVASMGCWLERQAVAQIEYLKAENRLLRSKTRRRRLLFSDAARRILATLAREVAAKALRDLDTFVSPATLLRWHHLTRSRWAIGNLNRSAFYRKDGHRSTTLPAPARRDSPRLLPARCESRWAQRYKVQSPRRLGRRLAWPNRPEPDCRRPRRLTVRDPQVTS